MKLTQVPRGLDEIIDLYGDPRDKNGEPSMEWYYSHTALYDLPMTMKTWGGRTTRVFRAHTIVGPVIQWCIAEIATRLGVGMMHQEGWDFWGGCWWDRPMRGYNALSTHAWGIAVDLNPHKAPQGGKPEDQHKVIVEVFEDAGFRWGGRWSAPYTCDPMHMQAASNF